MAGFHRQRRRSRRTPQPRPGAEPATQDAEPPATQQPPETTPPETTPPETTPPETVPAEARPAETKPPEVASSPEGAPPAGRGEESAPSPADLAAAHRNRPRPEAEAATAPAADPEEPVSVPASGREPAERDAERGLRGLVGSGSSQVGVWAAARARDAARPTDEDVRAAEQLPLVRRNWVPREPFRPNTRRS